MKKMFAFCIASFTIYTVSAQVSIKQNNGNRFLYKNEVALELGGHGLIYSINYERNFINTKRFKTSIQAGFSLYPSSLDLVSNFWLPISINQLISFSQHHIETGIGMVFTQEGGYYGDYIGGMSKNLHPYLSAKIGYRYQKPNGRMTYKLLFTPLWERQYDFTEFHPLGAFSIGYNF